MQDKLFDRRMFLRVGGRALAGLSVLARGSYAAPGKLSQATDSAGAEAPYFKVPPQAADCHHHLYDPKYPFAAGVTARQPDATAADYRLLERRLGIDRNVIVQPSQYGEDNSLLLAAIQALGRDKTRGIVCVPDTISDSSLSEMKHGGVCGVRFDFMKPLAPPSWNALQSMARRIEPLGWHVEVSAKAQDILSNKGVLAQLSCPIVFDHLARLPAAGNLKDQVFRTVCDLMTKRKAWCKITFDVSSSGAPTYADTVDVATEFVKEAPDRLVWGTNWPHPQLKQKPDDALLFDLLQKASPDAAVRNRILVSNAAEAYGF